MAEIRHVKRAEIEAIMRETQPGFYQAEMLPGSMEGVKTYKCRLLKGADCKLESYEKKGVSLFFIGGKGKVLQGNASFDVTERAVFCPDINV